MVMKTSAAADDLARKACAALSSRIDDPEEVEREIAAAVQRGMDMRRAISSDGRSPMTLDEYQEACSRTAIYTKTNIGGQRIVYCALALAGEVGEVANLVKKAVRAEGMDDSFYVLSGERPNAPGNVSAEVLDEVGDCFWYLAMLAHECGFTLGEVAERNLEKLWERHGK